MKTIRSLGGDIIILRFVKKRPESGFVFQRFSLSGQKFLHRRAVRVVVLEKVQVPQAVLQNHLVYEKGVDIQLATDMITHSYKGNYDVAILVAGDNDFVGALQAVKDNGKNVEVALFGKEWTSMQLRNVADRVINIDGRFLRNCWK